MGPGGSGFGGRCWEGSSQQTRGHSGPEGPEPEAEAGEGRRGEVEGACTPPLSPGPPPAASLAASARGTPSQAPCSVRAHVFTCPRIVHALGDCGHCVAVTPGEGAGEGRKHGRLVTSTRSGRGLVPPRPPRGAGEVIKDGPAGADRAEPAAGSAPCKFNLKTPEADDTTRQRPPCPDSATLEAP